jgi:hypothetical protein
MTEATAGVPLDTMMLTPRAGAIRDSVTSIKDIPPGAILDGLSVNEANVGSGGSDPPGFSVTTWGIEASSRETPDASL